MSFRDVISSPTDIFACALVMTLAVTVVRLILSASLSIMVQPILLIGVGGVVYISSLHLFKISAYLEIKRLVGGLLRQRAAQVTEA